MRINKLLITFPLLLAFSSLLISAQPHSSDVIVSRDEGIRRNDEMIRRHGDEEEEDQEEEGHEEEDHHHHHPHHDLNDLDSDDSSFASEISAAASSSPMEHSKEGGVDDGDHQHEHKDDGSVTNPHIIIGGGGHDHHHSGPVSSVFNESAIIESHGITPVSNLYYDWVLTPSQVLQASLRASLGEIVVLDQLEKRHDHHDEGTEEGMESPHSSSAPNDDSLAHPKLMLIHIISFSLSFFFCLPLSLALKAAKVVYLRDDPRGVRVFHLPGAIKLVVDVGYWIGLVLGWLSGTVYKSKTPELYKGHVHNLTGNMLLLVIIAISALDIISLTGRLISFTRIPSKHRDVESFNDIVLRGLGESASTSRGIKFATQARAESYALVQETQTPEDEDEDEVDLLPSSVDYVDRNSHGQIIFQTPWEENDAAAHHQSDVGRQIRIIKTDHRGSRLSNSSDSSTLRDPSSPSGSMDQHEPTKPRLMKASDFEALDVALAVEDDQDRHCSSRPTVAEFMRGFAKYFMIFINRGIVVWAYIVAVIGVCVYTGVGRGGYINGLAAHVIKGSIFFWYGVLTFARYLGAFADYGWAWNSRPLSTRNSRVPSAEFVECFVIFLYGISNTWMERFGVAPGSPYSVKQVQHISIAVMFWFAGLIGMGMETTSLKTWLASTVVSTAKKSGKARAKELAKPPTYAASFNPFPALVIGVLGVAMSAHHQDYVFQVTIHALWGYLLAGFSLFRLLTYFILYVAPPKESVMPTRPPTEALAAVSLACGGIVFILSDEEITFSAMRHGWDDMMAFLNLTVALVCLLFCWILTVMVAKGWAIQRRIDVIDDERRAEVYDVHDEIAFEG